MTTATGDSQTVRGMNRTCYPTAQLLAGLFTQAGLQLSQGDRPGWVTLPALPSAWQGGPQIALTTHRTEGPTAPFLCPAWPASLSADPLCARPTSCCSLPCFPYQLQNLGQDRHARPPCQCGTAVGVLKLDSGAELGASWCGSGFQPGP